ncbi:hypothetical protein B484DRAFT_439141, partial [Ochromonadaceae sp. CCMP2298]
VGLPMGMVVKKAEAEGLSGSILEDGTRLIPLNPSALDPTSAPGDPTSAPAPAPAQVAVSEHPHYAKYFKMLKVGLPLGMVKEKVKAEGLDVNMMDLPPLSMVNMPDLHPPAAAQMVAASEHPSYAKYFKMLKVGLPLVMVRGKAEKEGLDGTVLE